MKSNSSPDELILDELPDEDEEVNESHLNRIRDVVLNATDWTTETILNQLRRGTIDLNPKFQRRDAWNHKHKSRFIESLFLGLPIPQLVLAERQGRRGHFIVIDGKQRLLTLRQFAATADDGFQPLRLTGLEIKEELERLTLEEIEGRPELHDDLTAFYNQTIRTVVVRNWPDEDFLYLLFQRLNTGSVKLSPQELRLALNPGPFMDFVDEAASSSAALRSILGSQNPDFRMRDVEILIRYYAFKNYLDEYTGNLKSFLNMTCKTLNKEWPSRSAEIQAQAKTFEEAVAVTFEVFEPRCAFKKWTKDGFERSRNRAVIDIMLYFFSIPEIAEAAKQSRELVVEGFQRACEENYEFRQSLESSTKSVNATYVRLRTWAEVLSEALSTPIPMPNLINNRIQFNG